MGFLRRHGSLIVRIVFSVAILGYLASRINWVKLGIIWQTLAYGWVAAAFVCVGPTFIFTAWRWRLLLLVQKIDLPFREAYNLNMVGQFFNAFLLGATGGDVIKIYYATKAAPERKPQAALSVVMDRLVGLAMFVALAVALSVPYYRLLTSTPATAAALWSIFFIAAGGVCFALASLLMPWLHGWTLRRGWWHRLPFHQLLERLIFSYDEYARAPGTLLVAGLISVPSHLSNLLAGYCVARSLGLHPPLGPFFATIPSMMVLAAMPVSISGVGVREGLAVIFLGLFGIGQEYAVAYGLLIFAVGVVWSLIGGVFYLRYRVPAAAAAEG